MHKNKLSKRFFKGYVIKHRDAHVLNFEEVLFNIHSLYKKEDIIKTVKKEISEIKNKKDNKQKIKLDLYEKFIHYVNDQIGAGEESSEYDNRKKQLMEELIHKVDENINYRSKHMQYL